MKSRLPAALIVDVENTLFDWVSVSSRAFSALLDSLAATAEVRHALTARFRALHRQHASTEYPFALAELSSIDAEQPLTPFSPERLREAAARYRAAAESALATYPLVRETLAWFRTHGTAIVAVTETRIDVAGPRLRQLGLDGLVDMLYAPEPWEPRSIDAGLVLWPHGLPPLDATIARPLFGRIKPQPGVLRAILADLDVLPDEALYVGDDFGTDIAMARAAHVPAVWARYGAVSATADDGREPRPLIVDSLAELQARYRDGAWPDVRGESRAKGSARG